MPISIGHVPPVMRTVGVLRDLAPALVQVARDFNVLPVYGPGLHGVRPFV
jgi:hypothetical protein